MAACRGGFTVAVTEEGGALTPRRTLELARTVP
jgi:hypothetical protein